MKPNLCANCRHYGDNLPPPPAPDGRPRINKQPGENRMCMHPSTSAGLDLVSGAPIRTSAAAADLQRTTPNIIARWTGKCGTAGRHFEAVEDRQ